ncbi:hypothetical protein F2Q69_00061207 [Brassica cretica]|uniref:Uncharacterized protein n=1 Tax=Brassica cretica TaxID=69181 RepID=A0A8S9RT26_BRACR|nr:hypothetical protein F2Q69_00061207 [Brassica cretica]
MALIPMELFRFRNYDHSMLLANTNTDLQGRQTFIFDNLAMQLLDKLVIHGVEPRVISATNINPKLVGGRLFLNPASVTLFYFACECEANTSCIKGLKTSHEKRVKINGPCPAVRDGVPFEESPVEDCGPLQRSHEMVELQEIEVKVGVLVSQPLLLPLIHSV